MQIPIFWKEKKYRNACKFVDKVDADKDVSAPEITGTIKKKNSILYRDNGKCNFMVTLCPLKNQEPRYKLIWKIFIWRVPAKYGAWS